MGLQGLREFNLCRLVLQLVEGISGCAIVGLSSDRSPFCDWLGHSHHDPFLLAVALLWLLAVSKRVRLLLHLCAFFDC